MPKFESFSGSGSERPKKKKSKKGGGSKSGGLSGTGAGSIIGPLIELATLGMVSPPSEKRKKRK